MLPRGQRGIRRGERHGLLFWVRVQGGRVLPRGRRGMLDEHGVLQRQVHRGDVRVRLRGSVVRRRLRLLRRLVVRRRRVREPRRRDVQRRLAVRERSMQRRRLQRQVGRSDVQRDPRVRRHQRVPRGHVLSSGRRDLRAGIGLLQRLVLGRRVRLREITRRCAGSSRTRVGSSRQGAMFRCGYNDHGSCAIAFEQFHAPSTRFFEGMSLAEGARHGVAHGKEAQSLDHGHR